MIDTAVHWRQAQEAFAKGDAARALALLEQVVAENPADLEAYHVLGRILRFAGRPDEAAAWYRRCLEVAPGDAIAVMGLAALGRGPIPARLPDDVVRYIFDVNAETYEANMQSLGYHGPDALVDLLRIELPSENDGLDMLDLGCGSGLCASLVRPFARRLVGVDLCAGMLAIARRKNLYDELIEAELIDYLGRGPREFDVVVAANVLMYFGDLAPLMEGVARVLRAGGRFLFDVEKGEGGEPGFHVSGRYTHSRELLERTLAPRGFALAQVREAVMRKEQGAPVAALCCVARYAG